MRRGGIPLPESFVFFLGFVGIAGARLAGSADEGSGVCGHHGMRWRRRVRGHRRRRLSDRRDRRRAEIGRRGDAIDRGDDADPSRLPGNRLDLAVKVVVRGIVPVRRRRAGETRVETHPCVLRHVRLRHRLRPP